MGRKKRRSSKFRDSSLVIDMEQAREERRQRQEKRLREKQEKEERERAKQERREQSGPTRSGREAPINTSYSGPSSERQDRRRMALRRRRNSRRLIATLAAVFIVVVLGYSVGNILLLKHDLHTAEKEQVAYQEEKEQLQRDLKEIDDLQNLEEQARNQMRLIKPNETLYISPENMTQQ